MANTGKEAQCELIYIPNRGESRPFRSSALSFLGAKSSQRELSLPWNLSSVEYSLLGTFVPPERMFQELSFL